MRQDGSRVRPVPDRGAGEREEPAVAGWQMGDVAPSACWGAHGECRSTFQAAPARLSCCRRTAKCRMATPRNGGEPASSSSSSNTLDSGQRAGSCDNRNWLTSVLPPATALADFALRRGAATVQLGPGWSQLVPPLLPPAAAPACRQRLPGSPHSSPELLAWTRSIPTVPEALRTLMTLRIRRFS